MDGYMMMHEMAVKMYTCGEIGDLAWKRLAWFQPPVCRGVGLHHGGLLPVLRELTEKLFKERSAAYFEW